MTEQGQRMRSIVRAGVTLAAAAVLYELLAGQRAFESGNMTNAIAGVIEHEPDWHALPAGTPTKIRDLLRRCLQRDANCRLTNIADARATLEDVRRRQARRRAAPRSAAASGRERRPATARSGFIHPVYDPRKRMLTDALTNDRNCCSFFGDRVVTARTDWPAAHHRIPIGICLELICVRRRAADQAAPRWR